MQGSLSFHNQAMPRVSIRAWSSSSVDVAQIFNVQCIRLTLIVFPVLCSELCIISVCQCWYSHIQLVWKL